MRKRGNRLKVGDIITVWWERRDIIVALHPYRGRLAHLFSSGAQLATFAVLRTGMTIDNNELYQTHRNMK